MAPIKDYTPEQMGRALEAVRRGEPVATAAKKYGVPRCTLRNKFIGKSPVVCTMGPATVLPNTEEKILVDWIIAMSERHCPVGKDQLLDSVQKIVNEGKRATPFTDNRPGKKWFNAFLDRHPELTLRVSQNLTKSRDNVTEEQIRTWFSDLQKYFEDNNLADALKDPQRVFNTDESAFFLNPKNDRVLVKRGEKNVYIRSGNEKENLTILITANAAGQLPPPMMVFTYERVPGYIANSVPEDWGIGLSESGWMCGRTFFEYMTNVFHPWLLSSGIQLPIIFFLDGHASHLTLHLAEFCASNQIELIALYPNSTHLLQPMDVAVFRPLKVFYKKNIRKWKSEHLGHEVKKENLGPILEASLREVSSDCIKNGFRAGGLHPFGPDYVDFSKLSKKNRTENNPEASISSTDIEDNNFLKKLETEVVNIYNPQKLHLFKECFYKHRDDLQDQLPNEDLSLYILWAKYKHKCHIVGNTTATTEKNTATITSLSATINHTSQNLNNISAPALIDQPLLSQNKINVTDDDSEPILAQFDGHLEMESNKDIANCTPTKTAPSSSSFANYMLKTSNTEIPSPFKKALFWPEPEKKKRRLTKEKIPSAITSKAWREYSEKKQLQKKVKEDEKEKRKLEREQKKRLREENTKNKKTQKKKGCSSANNLKKAQNKKRKRPKESSSSDDATNSDVTYVETGESECSDMEIEYLEEEDNDIDITEKRKVTEKDEINIKNLDLLPANNHNTRPSSSIEIVSDVSLNIVLDDRSGKFIAVQDSKKKATKPANTISDECDTGDQEQIIKNRERQEQAWMTRRTEAREQKQSQWRNGGGQKQTTEINIKRELGLAKEEKEEGNQAETIEMRGKQEHITKEREVTQKCTTEKIEKGETITERKEVEEQKQLTERRENRENNQIKKEKKEGKQEYFTEKREKEEHFVEKTKVGGHIPKKREEEENKQDTTERREKEKQITDRERRQTTNETEENQENTTKKEQIIEKREDGDHRQMPDKKVKEQEDTTKEREYGEQRQMTDEKVKEKEDTTKEREYGEQRQMTDEKVKEQEDTIKEREYGEQRQMTDEKVKEKEDTTKEREYGEQRQMTDEKVKEQEDTTKEREYGEQRQMTDEKVKEKEDTTKEREYGEQRQMTDEKVKEQEDTTKEREYGEQRQMTDEKVKEKEDTTKEREYGEQRQMTDEKVKEQEDTTKEREYGEQRQMTDEKVKEQEYEEKRQKTNDIKEQQQDTKEKREQEQITKGGKEEQKQKANKREVELDEDIMEDFLINDGVIVRYYQRKHWKYYIGFIQNLVTEDDKMFYSVKFLKSVKKPELKFVLSKKLDHDIVPRDSIVKKVKLCQYSLPSNEYYLCDDIDKNYF